MRDTKYPEIGLQMRAIREQLEMTLDEMSKATGISRSYISEFERGIKMPTSKYLRYLHDNNNINIHYVFGSEPDMFRKKPGDSPKPPEFGKYKEDVDEMNIYMAKMPPVLFAMLGFFSEYKMKNRQLIKEHFSKFEDEDTGNA
jgi:transcriptional regulator with XRE-family HTH domain